MIKAIVFDFDGVIVDSVNIKRQTYFDLFENSRIHDTVFKVLLEIEGNTRFDILRSILTEPDSKELKLEQKIKKYSDKYNNLVQKAIKKRGPVLGAPETLSVLNRNFSIYINSNTPQEPLEESLYNLGINNYFKGIFGVPKINSTYVNSESKKNNLLKIIKLERTAPNKIVFVGDSKGDLNAAIDIGCLFIGVEGRLNQWSKQNFPLIKHLKEIPEIVKTL